MVQVWSLGAHQSRNTVQYSNSTHTITHTHTHRCRFSVELPVATKETIAGDMFAQMKSVTGSLGGFMCSSMNTIFTCAVEMI